MIPGVLVWTAGRAGGIFDSREEAIRAVKVLTNDHRRKVELTELSPAAVRYVGPRGRRHGTRLVAFIGTHDGLADLGLDMRAIAARMSLEA